MKLHIPGREPTADITPVRRDLLQFISPNPRSENLILMVRETTGTELKRFEECFAAWEDKNPAAIIIDTTGAPKIRDENYLMKLRETLECPVIRLQTIKEQDDIFDARLLQFDAQISPISHINTNEYMNLNKLSQGIHFRIIPLIQSDTDWKITVAAQPRFYYVSSTLGSIPPMITDSQSWLIGHKTDAERFPLKCQVETLN